MRTRCCPLVIAAAQSNSGKTMFALALIVALRKRGLRVAAMKSGPDYIDTRFLSAALCASNNSNASNTDNASHAQVYNADTYAMHHMRLYALYRTLSAKNDCLVIEGAMGLFDGVHTSTKHAQKAESAKTPPLYRGSTADLARCVSAPVVVLLDAARVGHSLAAIARGFITHHPNVHVLGVIANRVKSKRHADIVKQALQHINIPLFGCIRDNSALCLPERHLGLQQASEHRHLYSTLRTMHSIVEQQCDIDRLWQSVTEYGSFAPTRIKHKSAWQRIPPLGQRIAVAYDDAFRFTYAHMLDDWHNAGASVHLFSPLHNESPDAQADAVFLPGGYPELYAAKIAAAAQFKHSMQRAAARGVCIYGECGGFMVLGSSLETQEKQRYPMLDLLPLDTRMGARLTLGYRVLTPADTAMHCVPQWHGLTFMGHEFHYGAVANTGSNAAALWRAHPPDNQNTTHLGCAIGRVAGSFAHVIDLA